MGTVRSDERREGILFCAKLYCLYPAEYALRLNLISKGIISLKAAVYHISTKVNLGSHFFSKSLDKNVTQIITVP